MRPWGGVGVGVGGVLKLLAHPLSSSFGLAHLRRLRRLRHRHLTIFWEQLAKKINKPSHHDRG